MLPEEIHRIAQSLVTYGDFLRLPNGIRLLITSERRMRETEKLNICPQTLTGRAWRYEVAKMHSKSR